MSDRSSLKLEPVASDAPPDCSSGRTCPRCGHVRAPNEPAPDWQCPACGVAYAKAARDPEGAKHVSLPRTRRGGVSLGWVAGAGLLLALLVAAWPRQEPVDLASLTADPSIKVVMFATKWCGYCRQAREFFASHKVPYVEYDVEENDRNQQMFRSLGGRGVPFILVGQERMNGFNAGYLQQLLSQEGVI